MRDQHSSMQTRCTLYVDCVESLTAQQRDCQRWLGKAYQDIQAQVFLAEVLDVLAFDDFDAVVAGREGVTVLGYPGRSHTPPNTRSELEGNRAGDGIRRLFAAAGLTVRSGG